MSRAKVVVLIALMLVLVGSAWADVPRLISYQGRLTDRDGIPLEGLYDITFRLYTVSTDGIPIWEETHNDVEVTNGLYNVILASETPFPPTVDFTRQYWLGVQVEGGEEFSPRYQLGATPYALALADTLYKDRKQVIYGNVEINATESCPPGFKMFTVKDSAGVELFSVGEECWHAVKIGENATVIQYRGGVTNWSLDNNADLKLGRPTAGSGQDGDIIVYNGSGGQTFTVDGSTGDVHIGGRFLDSSGDAGSSGQILSSTGTGTDWINAPSGEGLWTDNGTYISPNNNSNVKIYDSGQIYVFQSAGELGSQVGVSGSVTGSGSGERYGVMGNAGTLPSGGTSYGVHGTASGGSMNYGVYGDVGGNPGYGVYANGGAGRAWAGLGSGDPGGPAGYFHGDVEITGSLSKGSGSFLIDHPLDPLHKLLRHNFVESPENLCLYRGKVRLNSTGKAVVHLPEYFSALTKEEEATVTLTPIGHPFSVGYDWNHDFTAFTIYGEPLREISYIVLADRDDPVIHQLHRPVEESKKNSKICPDGKLLYPAAYGYPENMGKDYHQQRNED